MDNFIILIIFFLFMIAFFIRKKIQSKTVENVTIRITDENNPVLDIRKLPKGVYSINNKLVEFYSKSGIFWVCQITDDSDNPHTIYIVDSDIAWKLKNLPKKNQFVFQDGQIGIM